MDLNEYLETESSKIVNYIVNLEELVKYLHDFEWFQYDVLTQLPEEQQAAYKKATGSLWFEDEDDDITT